MNRRNTIFVTVAAIVIVSVFAARGFVESRQSSRTPAAGPAPLSVHAGSGGPPAPELAGPELIIHPAVVPVAVNLREVPTGVPDPNSKLQRWLRGEWQPGRPGLPVTDVEYRRMQEEAAALPPSSAVQLIDERPGKSAPAVGTSFDSIHFAESSGSVPPDPDLAVGPNHIVAAVNVDFEIYSKNGTSLTGGPVSFASFLSPLGLPAGGSYFDPNALYDEETGRYMLAIDYRDLNTSSSYYVVAVSQTGDAAASYWLYAFTANGSSSALWMDYPHAGIGRDAIYMGGNMFTFANDSFTDARIWAFDKAAMYAGAAATAVEQSLGANEFTPQPLKLHGWNGSWPTGNLHYFLSQTGDYFGDNYRVWSWDRPFSTNSLVNRGFSNLANATGVTAGIPVDVPQLGGGTLAGNDKRPLDLEWGAGSLWTAQTISCNPGSGTVNCVRWAEINPANANVLQAGVWAGNGIYLTFPDLAVNDAGDMAIGYTKSSASTYPSVWAAGRAFADPAGNLSGETLLKAGEIKYLSFEPDSPRRWGDYTGMTVDPDGVSFWYLGEYSKNTGTTQGRWGNWIAEIGVAGGDAIFLDGFESGSTSAWSGSS